MSTANPAPRETYQCETCGDPTPGHETVAGSFCSQSCHARHRGQKLLNKLEEDHTYCYSCFGRLKHVEEPSDEWRHRKNTPFEIALDQGATFTHGPDGSIVLDATPCRYRKAIDPDAVIGYQYGTENAQSGVVEDEIMEYVTIERPALICKCGNTHHATREEAIQSSDIVTVTRNLISSLHQLHDDGVHDHHINPHTLIQEIRDQVPKEGWDFAAAVGHAIQDQ